MPQRAFRIPRERMVREQLEARGISDPFVLNAMRSVPRHVFVPQSLEHAAYEDRPLFIDYGQTISQPYIVGLMTESLEVKKDMTVLEIGTGSGYQAAILHEMGACVFTVERLKEHYFQARERFNLLGMKKIRTHLSDGTLGWPEMAPFDRILVAAGGPSVPEALLSQMADNGVMVLPVGSEKRTQELIRVRREGEKFYSKVLRKVSFVDLVGAEGW